MTVAMSIIESGLRFSKMPNRTRTNAIIVHHTASRDVTVEDVHRWHLDRGWAGIGYHYLIRADGRIFRGRRETARGTHAANFNASTIGIALTGNFEQHAPTAAQINSLSWLIRDIRTRHSALRLMLHRDVGATLCPGRNFDLSLIT